MFTELMLIIYSFNFNAINNDYTKSDSPSHIIALFFMHTFLIINMIITLVQDYIFREKIKIFIERTKIN